MLSLFLAQISDCYELGENSLNSACKRLKTRTAAILESLQSLVNFQVGRIIKSPQNMAFLHSCAHRNEASKILAEGEGFEPP